MYYLSFTGKLPGRRSRVKLLLRVRLKKHVRVAGRRIIPFGAVVWVRKINRVSYRGTWRSSYGDWTVTVPKAACRTIK